MTPDTGQPRAMPRGAILTAILTLALALPGTARALNFSYSDFSDTSGLTLNGNAAQSGAALRLVPSLESQGGTAFYNTALGLTAGTSFSTAFSFLVTSDTNSLGGATDGFSFILQGVGLNALGAGGQGLGYTGLSPSVTVAFRGRAPSFIGAITNGTDPANLAIPFDPPGAATGLTEGSFYDQTEYAWIDYAAGTLSAYLSTTDVKPAVPVMSAAIDIPAVFAGQAYVGFGAGNGGAFASQDINSWSFGSETAAAVPEPASALLLAAAGLALGASRRGSAGGRRRSAAA